MPNRGTKLGIWVTPGLSDTNASVDVENLTGDE